MSKWVERVVNALCIAVIALSCAAFVRPGGPGATLWTRMKLERAQRAKIRAGWPRVSANTGRLDVGAEAVQLVEYSDYECPFCRKQHAEILRYLAANPRVGLAYRHFPLPIHPAAEGGAIAAMCAQAQGRFREMNDRLFTTEQWRTDRNWLREARRAGVPDTVAFAACVAAPATKAQLAREIEQAHALGVRGTPTWITSSVLRPGFLTAEQLPKLLDGTLPPSPASR